MNLPETIYAHARSLPVDLQRETLAFIANLEQQHGIAPPGAGRLTTELFIRQLAGALPEDFPDDIEDADLVADAPRESLE